MTDPTDPAGDQQKPAHLFQPGQSGNPNGRTKGSRNKLGEAFLKALSDDFDEHGASAIQKTRETKPEVYVKVVASLLPKRIEIKDGAFDNLTDEELTALVLAARDALSVARGGGSGAGEAEGDESASPISAVH